jgi:putative FmdB family regulatory protein
MPLYEYKCDRCNEVFEVIQKFSDEPLSVHDHCGGALERLISSPALQFKGSGWYVTDYAKKGSSSTKSNGDSSPSKDSPASSESKPAESKVSEPKSTGAKPEPAK